MAGPLTDLLQEYSGVQGPGGEMSDLGEGQGQISGLLNEYTQQQLPGGMISDVANIKSDYDFEKSYLDEFTSGVGTGTDMFQASLYAMTKALGREMGFDGLEEWGDEGMQANIEQMQRDQPTVGGFTNIESFDDFVRWAANSFGQALPSLGSAMAGGGIGGVLLKKGVERSIARVIRDRMLRQMKAKGFTDDVAEEAVERALRSRGGMDMLKNGFEGRNAMLLERGFTRGATLGAVLPSTAAQAGETEMTLSEQGIDGSLAAIFGTGFLGGSLEALPALRLIDKMFPGVDKQISGSFIRDFAKATGTQAVLEGSTEGAQEVIQLAALAYHDPTFEWTEENTRQVIDSFAAGALVGAVTGGAGETFGRVTTGEAPTPGPQGRLPRAPREHFRDRYKVPGITLPDGFDPADNTVVEEIKGRVENVLNNTLEPALNKVRNTFDEGFERVRNIQGAGISAYEGLRQYVDTVNNAHDEFIAGHQPVIDDTVRFARESIMYIAEQAEAIADPAERQAFIEESLAEVQEQVGAVAVELGQRGEQIAGATLQNIQGDPVISGPHQSQPFESETDFVFGQTQMLKNEQGQTVRHRTRGEQAVPHDTKEKAVADMAKLRGRYPSAPESAFNIREQGDGWVVSVEDSGIRTQLIEDEIVTDALEAARVSARSHRNERRKAKVKNRSNNKGQNLILDVPTLVYAGRKLGEGDVQTVEQGFNTIAGRMLERGIIDDEGYSQLRDAFIREFPKRERKWTLAQAQRIRQTDKYKEMRQEDMDKTVMDPLRDRSTKTVVKKRGGVSSARRVDTGPAIDAAPRMQRTANQVVDPDTGEVISVRTGNPEITQEGGPVRDISGPQQDFSDQLGPEGMFPSRSPEATITQRQQLEDTQEGTNVDEDAELLAKLETEEEQAQAQSSSNRSRSLPQQPVITLEEMKERAQELTSIGDTRENNPELAALEDRIAEIENPKGDKRSPRQVMNEKQRKRLAEEEKRDKERKAKRKEDTTEENLKRAAARRKAKKPAPPAVSGIGAKPTTLEYKVATNAAKGVDGIFFTKENKPHKAAVQALLKPMRKLLGKTGPTIMIVDRATAKKGAAEATSERHRYIMRALESQPPYSMVYDNEYKSAYIMIDDFNDNPASMALGLVHEFGHILHYHTWDKLNFEGQNALWQAFKKDVDRGWRASGKYAQLDPEGNTQEHTDPQKNIHEFQEWMADQFVDWMNNRRAPRNALERFLEAVATKIDQFRALLAKNPGRFGQLNEDYGDFIDGIAMRVAGKADPRFDKYFSQEGGPGLNWESLENKLDNLDLPLALRRKSIEERAKKLDNPHHNLPQESWQKMAARQLSYQNIVAKGKEMWQMVHNLYTLAAAPATSTMRDLSSKGVRAADKLVHIFNRQEHGTAKMSRNYHQRVKLLSRGYMNRYRAVVASLDEAGKAKLYNELREADKNGTPVQSREAKEIQAIFDEMRDYLVKAGLPVGKRENYLPRQFDRDALIAKEEEVLAYLESKFKRQMSEQERAEQAARGENVARDMARRWYNSVVHREADEAAALHELETDELSMQSPYFGAMRSRTSKDEFFDQFLNTNIDSVFANYVNTAVKRAEYNRLLGMPAPKGLTGGDMLPRNVWNPQQKLDDIFAEALDQGATDEELMQMKRYVDANLGMYGRDDISDTTRKFMAGVVAYNNMRTLLFTVFASLPDLMGPAIRSNDMKGAFATFRKNIQSVVKNNEDNLTEMAQAWGVITDEANQHVLTEYVDNHYMPTGLRKWNDAFFKWTGLNWYTDATRKFALAVGIDTMKQAALDAKDMSLPVRKRDRAKRYLKELGLTPKEVNDWVARGEPIWNSPSYTQSNINEETRAADEKIAEASLQFVDEAIMSPNPSQRPILASHPGAMLVYHLKGFMYAIYDIMIKRMAFNWQDAKTNPEAIAAVAPALGMIALTAVGLELRELITGSNQTDRMDGWDYTGELVQRSGLLGPAQLGWDFQEAGARGQSELAGLSGPAISQLGDLISKPASQTIPKAIPVVSQLPWARDALRESTPL